METMASTVAIYKIFSSKKIFTDKEAQFLASAIEQKESLATKEDISGVKLDIVNVRSELKQDIADLRTELKGDIASLRTDVDNKLNKLSLRGFAMASVIFVAIIATNPRALELISRLCGIAK